MIKAILTIDDIASDNTPNLVDYLVEKGIKVLMFAEGARIEKHPENDIILMHDHEETLAMVPDYYKIMLEHVMENGVTFVEPTFI